MAIVDQIYTESVELRKILEAKNEISSLSSVEDWSRKNLLLASASYFEHRIKECIVTYYNNVTNGDLRAIEFVEKKALERQYHTLFSWKENNANSFFSHFGSDFLAQMKTIIKEDYELENSINAFMEIGRERNRLVHENYGSFVLEKNIEELYNLHKKAEYFVGKLPTLLITKSVSD